MVTGHRPKQLVGDYNPKNPLRVKIYNRMKNQVETIKNQKLDISLISGMALGIDQDFARIAIELRVPLLAYIPFIGQERKWNIEAQKTYLLLLQQADEILVCSDGEYTAQKMQIRNERMIQDADHMIAVLKSSASAGGTWNCVNAAKVKKSMKLHIIDPDKEKLNFNL